MVTAVSLKWVFYLKVRVDVYILFEHSVECAVGSMDWLKTETSGSACVVFTVKNRPAVGFEVSNDHLQAAVERAASSSAGVHRKHHDNWLESTSIKLSQFSSSTGVGLAHVHLACQGAGGSFTLALDGDGWVVCSIVFPAQLTQSSSLRDRPPILKATSSRSFEICDFPVNNYVESKSFPDELLNGCKMLAIDDSKVLLKR
jgi:hypothetical protein